MTVGSRLRPFRTGWWLVALGVLVGLAAAQVVLARTTPLYRSTTQLFVGAAGPADTTTAAYNGGLFTQQRVASYVSLIESDRLGREVVDDLRLPVPAEQLAGQVTGTALPNTVILQITVTDTSARGARDVAAAYGRHVIDDVTELERPDPSAPSAVKVSTLQPASLERDPVSPDAVRDRGLGALLGLLAGGGLAVLVSRRRRTVATVEDVGAAIGAPVLATVPRDGGSTGTPPATLLDPASAGPEEARLLRTRVYPPGGASAPATVVVTSPDRDQATTRLAVQFAAAVARGGRRVLLVDADLGRPQLSSSLGCADVEGLAEVLAGTADESAVIRPAGPGGVAVLPAGRRRGEADDEVAGLFAAPKMRALLDTLCTAYDTVVVAGPPVLTDGDAGAVGALGDGCLLVAVAGTTRRRRLAQAAATLSWYGVALLGGVLVQVPERSARPRRTRYPADPDRAAAMATGTVEPDAPFGPAAPSGRLLPTSAPAGNDPS